MEIKTCKKCSVAHVDCPHAIVDECGEAWESGAPIRIYRPGHGCPFISKKIIVGLVDCPNCKLLKELFAGDFDYFDADKLRDAEYGKGLLAIEAMAGFKLTGKETAPVLLVDDMKTGHYHVHDWRYLINEVVCDDGVCKLKGKGKDDEKH